MPANPFQYYQHSCFVISIGITLFLFSCNSKEKKADGPFKVVMQVRILEDDKLQLFYLNHGQRNFTDKNVIKVNVGGSTNYQTIAFELPERTFPSSIRIDIGEHKIESSIDIKSCEIIFEDQTLEIEGASFDRFFKSNIYITNVKENSYLRSVVDNKYDPFFVSTAYLEQYLKLKF